MNFTFKSLDKEAFFPNCQENQNQIMLNKEQFTLTNNYRLVNDSYIKVIILLLLHNPKYKMHLYQSNHNNDIINKTIIQISQSLSSYDNLYSNLVSLYPKVNFLNHPLNTFHIILKHLYTNKLPTTVNDFYMCVTQNIQCTYCGYTKNKFIITNNYYHEIPIYSIVMLTKEEHNSNYIVDLNRTLKFERKNSNHNLNKLYNKLFIYYLSHHRKALFICDKCKNAFNNNNINSKLTLQHIPLYLHFSFLQDKSIFKLSLYDSLIILILLPKVFELQQLFEHNNFTNKLFYSLTSITFLTQTNVWSIAIKKQDYWEFHTNNYVNKVIRCESYFELIECVLRIGAIPLFVAYQQQEKYLDYCENELNVNEIDFLEKYVHHIDEYEGSLKENSLRIKENVIESNLHNISINNSMYSIKKNGINNNEVSNKTTTSNSTVSKNNNSNMNNSLEVNFYNTKSNTIPNKKYEKKEYHTERSNYHYDELNPVQSNNTIEHNGFYSEISKQYAYTKGTNCNKEKDESEYLKQHIKSFRGIIEYQKRNVLHKHNENSQNRLRNQNDKMCKQKGNSNKSYSSNINNNIWKCDICEKFNNSNDYRCSHCKTITICHNNEYISLTSSPNTKSTRRTCTPLINNTTPNKRKPQKLQKSITNVKSTSYKSIYTNFNNNNPFEINKYSPHQKTLQHNHLIPKQTYYELMLLSNNSNDINNYSIKTD